MRPLTLPERGFATPTVSLGQLLAGQRPTLTGASAAGLEDYVNEILRSGLPGIRDLADRGLRRQLDSYLSRVVDRDIEMEAGRRVRNPERVRRWMEAYAAATATTASFETIRAAASDARGQTAAKSTAIPYRDALERLWITDPLPAWTASRNRLGRVGLPPKHHLADPALAARLLGVGSDALLRGASAGPRVPRDGTLVGALFESLVTLGVRVFAQHSEARVGHLRTWSGDREVDLIVERDDGRVLAIEVKLSRTVDDAHVRNLIWLRDKIGPDLLDAIVITTGPDAYRRRDGIGVVPAALLGP
jgi:uncharacterized protein